MKNKKALLIGFSLLLLVVGGFLFLRRQKNDSPGPTPTPTPVALINQLPVKERPYVTLVPRADGREVTLTVFDNRGAERVEYELEYQAGNLIQGVFGRIDFTEEKPPVSKKLLFGSCSKGKCKYDENVSGGSLTLRFEGGENFALKGNFTLQQMAAQEGLFTSRDGRLSLEVPEGSLPATTYLIVADTFGLPGQLEGEVVAGPYGFFTAEATKLKKPATLTFKLSQQEEVAALKVFAWVNDQWQPLDEGREEQPGQLSVTLDRLTTVVLAR